MEIKNLQQNCYVPYSNKDEVAIVESTNGNVYPGVRVENLSFPLTIPAVQNAIYCCLSEGKTPSKLFANKVQADSSAFWINEYSLTVHPFKKAPTNQWTDGLMKDIDIRTTLTSLLDKALVNNSHFPVACLLETDRGYISGVNIENSQWTQGLCAERVALGKAFSYGVTHFKALHIQTRKGEYCSPCGACRQVLIEHLPDCPVHLYHPDGTQSVHNCADLLPYSFQSSSLASD